MLSEREEKLLGQLLTRYRHSEVGRLIKGIVHNMNNLAHTVFMQVELLRRRLAGLAAIREAEELQAERERCLAKVDEIAEEMARLNQLIAAITLKGAHDEAPDVAAIDINDLLREELTVLRGDMFFKHQVEHQTEFEEGLPPIRGCWVDLSQSLSNILRNAVEAMHGSDRRRLTLSTSLEGDEIEVRVTDTGPGIPPENRARIFHPFFTTKPDRCGLGLYLARRLLEPYQGRIEFESGEGGTTFAVRIPVKQEFSR